MGRLCSAVLLCALIGSGYLAFVGAARSKPASGSTAAAASSTSLTSAAAGNKQQPPKGTPQQQAAAFSAAPSCRALPMAATSSPDSTGRLWGTGASSSSSSSSGPCAFKDGSGHALFYTGYEPGSWLHTAPCSMQAFSDNSVADSKLRTWGWEASGSLCAFKDDQQLPIPQQRDYVMLSWQDTPACQDQPNPTAANAVPDAFGCLWGWQLDRTCAFRDGESGRALYYAGYSGKCDVAGSVRRAAEFNAKSAGGKRNTPSNGKDQGLNTPRVVTGLGCIGQKNAPAAAGSNSAPCVDTTVPANFGPGPA